MEVLLPCCFFWGLVVVYHLHKPGRGCVLGSRCTSLPFFVFLTLTIFILCRAGSSGPAERVLVSAERVGDATFDSHTEVWTWHEGALCKPVWRLHHKDGIFWVFMSFEANECVNLSYGGCIFCQYIVWGYSFVQPRQQRTRWLYLTCFLALDQNQMDNLSPPTCYLAVY